MKGKKRITTLIVAALILVCAGTVYADKTITGLGTRVISNPVNGNTQDLTSWKGSYVYYGKYNGSPVKYRVLDKASTAFGGNTMLLDCDSTLFLAAFDTADLNKWEDSSLRKDLNEAGFYFKEGVFSAVEREAVAASTKGRPIRMMEAARIFTALLP